MAHFHVWTRSGRIFTMQPRVFASRHTATKVARRLRSNGADRLVLACEACPGPRPSKRRPPRWGVVARAVAEAVGAKPTDVRQALALALGAERRRRAEEPAGGGGSEVADRVLRVSAGPGSSP